MSSALSDAYGRHYQARVRNLLRGEPVTCAHCRREQATTLDHDPPIAMHKHRPGARCCRLIPSCEHCNREGGLLVQQGLWRPGLSVVELEPEPERDGLEEEDRRWRVPWLRELRKVPDNAVWPRLMTVPHPRATGSLGKDFIRWAEERSGRELRWWQRLVATRLLEVDADKRLVWETLVLSVARQLGKSWLLRELLLWRMHQGGRFGEQQDVIHTGKDVAVCKEVQRPAIMWARSQPADYLVREANGEQRIEWKEDGSRWMLRAKEATYGYSISVGAVDEAWKVKLDAVDDGLTPTMVEREQPQLWLISTAHRLATPLMLSRRQVALADLEVGDGDLLIEWSAPANADIDDVDAWRLASPHWTPHRQRHIQKQLEAAQNGGLDDPDEPDPEASFRSQWMNQWPRKQHSPSGSTERLLPEGLWAELADEATSSGPVWVAVEDDFGLGAAVAAAGRLGDGRLEVDGWLCPDWDSAIGDVVALADVRAVKGLLIGASLMDRIPAGLPSARPAGARETRTGLALLRDLAVNEQLAHDLNTVELDQAVEQAHVRETSSGLQLAARGPTHLVKAMVWAVQAAHKRSPTPAIH